MLTREQVEFYRENGFLVVEGVLDPDKLARLRQVTDEIVAGAKGMTTHSRNLELEDSHTATAPRVRRIDHPHEVHQLYRDLVADPAVLAVVQSLLGPNVRYQDTALIMKSAGYGAPIHWHQDWAFHPHTNDDQLFAGVLLDDCTGDNGPLRFVPRSHKGPVYDHHANGRFAGAINLDTCDIDFSTAVPAIGKAGALTLHHTRVIHGSTANTSTRARRVLYLEYAAADAWPLLGLGKHYSEDPKIAYDVYNERVVAGAPVRQPRMADVPVILPLPPPLSRHSIFESQKVLAKQHEPFAMMGGS